MSTATTPTDRLIRINEVLTRVPVSKSTWYQGVKDGRYPAAIKIGRRASAWRLADIQRIATHGYQATPEAAVPADDSASI